MIDINKLSETDRALIIAYTNAMRDIDTLAILAKPMTRVGSSKKKKIWKRFTDQADKPMAESFSALNQLRQSANVELRELANKAITDSEAGSELRRLGKQIKLL